MVLSGNVLSRVVGADQVEWRGDAPGLVRGHPLVVEDRVVLNSGPHTCSLRGADRQGHTVWTAEKPTGVNDIPLADDHGRVFVPTRDGGFMALNAANGKPLWEIDDYEIYKRACPALRGDGFDMTGAQGRPALSPDQKTVYFTAWEGVLVAAEADTGAISWSLSSERFTNHGSPAVSRDGSIYYTDDANFLVKATPDGELAWEKPLGKHLSVPTTDGDGRPVVADGQGLISVLDPEDGEPLRTFQADGPVRTPPVFDPVTGRMFAASGEGTVYCLEPDDQDGFTVVWSQPHAARVSDLSLDPEGRVCVAQPDHGLTVYEPDGSLFGLVREEGCNSVTPAGQGFYLLGGSHLVNVRPTLAAMKDNLAAAAADRTVLPTVTMTDETVEIGDFWLFIER